MIHTMSQQLVIDREGDHDGRNVCSYNPSACEMPKQHCHRHDKSIQYFQRLGGTVEGWQTPLLFHINIVLLHFNSLNYFQKLITENYSCSICQEV